MDVVNAALKIDVNYDLNKFIFSNNWKNIIILYLNIQSIRNKLNDLDMLIHQSTIEGRTVHVVAIYKSGNKEVCSNYRPITKLSTIDKVFENILLNRLKEFIKTYEIISDNQFGFTEKSSTLVSIVQSLFMKI